MEFNYFKDINDIVSIHDKTIEVSGGGAHGIIDLASLECAIDQIKNDLYYPEFEDKLTHLFWVANKSHCFQDGNKRIAITIGAKFLLNNGYVFLVSNFLTRMEVISYHVAAGNIEKDLLHEIITSIIYDDDYNEELKLKILTAISNGVDIDFGE